MLQSLYSNLHQAYLASVVLVAATIPFHLKYNNIAIGMLVLVWSIGALKRKFTLHNFLSNFGNIFLLLIFCFHVIGLLYSEHPFLGIKKLERLLPFFAFPILLYPLKKVELSKLALILKVFVLACFVSSIIALAGSLIETVDKQAFYTFNEKTKENNYHFFYHNLTSNIGLHAVYFSLYIALSHLFVIKKILFDFSSLNKKEKIFLFFLSIYFPLILYLSQSLIIIFGWGICLLFLLLNFGSKISSLKKKKVFWLLAIFILFPIAFVGYGAVKEKVKIQNLGEFNYSDGPHSGNWGTINIRLAKWNCAYEVLKENFWFGTGTGDGASILFKKYEQKGFWFGLQKKFNPHNQFLSFGITLGIFAVLLFCSHLLWLFFNAIRYKNYLFICFLILFSLFSLTESTLATNKGIVFFVFFSLYFINSTINEKNDHYLKFSKT